MAQMASFQCKVITPMLLYGANQDVPEFRSQSIRGGLRWWFRAIAGSFLSQRADLLEKENSLFGDAGDKIGSSPIVVRVNYADEQFTTDTWQILPHRQLGKKRGIRPGVEFQVELSKSFYHKEDQRLGQKLNVVTCLFELMATLGGMGLRQRRTFGSFAPNEWMFLDKEQGVTHVNDVIARTQKAIHAYLGGQPEVYRVTNAVSSHPVLHPHVCTISMGEPVDWSQFIIALMTDLSRGKKVRDYPISVLGDHHNRQASTLIVSVLPSDSQLVYPVYTQFYCNTNDTTRYRGNFGKMSQIPANTSRGVVSVAF